MPSPQDSGPSLFDPRDPHVRSDPYPYYAHLREHHPAYYNPVLKKWMITRNTDVTRLLKDRRLSAQTATLRLPNNSLLRWLVKPIADTLPHTMIYSDPPKHTGLRQIASKFFTKQKIAELEGRVQTLAEETLAQIKDPSDFELVADFSFPFTASVIAELLGIPTRSLPLLGKHSSRIAELVVSLSASPIQGILAARSVGTLSRYFKNLIQEKRKNPGNDMISALANSEDGPLDDDQIINLSVLLVIAGHETTKNLISSAILHLLKDPAQYQTLRSNPQMMESAVEEFLRYDSSVQAVFRVALEEIEVGEAKIPKGSPILLMTGAANRDASAFDRPDTLDLSRSPNPHISFGGGLHFCLGAFLARLEARIGLNTILARFSELELIESQHQWMLAITHRGLKQLRLRSNQ